MKLFLALGIVNLLASVADGGVSMHDPFYCYSTDPIRPQTHMMTSITSYEAIRRFNFTLLDPYTPAGTPSRLWYLGRHGTRFVSPTWHRYMIEFAESSVQADIVTNYVAGRTTLCRQDFEAIRDFEMDSEFGGIDNATMPLESGRVAMRNIGRRLQQSFPHILSPNYSRDRFLFRHTNSVRTNTSIRAFASGLFGEAESQNVIYEDVPNFDWFLRPSEVCPAFSREIANSSAYRIAFEKGPEMAEMVEQANRRLGFQVSNSLTLQQIRLMAMWCIMETAAKFELSNSEIGGDAAWCSALSIPHLQLFDYSDDMDYFYSSGYGVRNQRLLENMNCGLVQDLLAHMESDNNDEPMARIFVTDAQEVLRMLVLLGAFRDMWQLHQHNFAQQSDRRWRSSMIAPFSANIVVVRYDSEDDGDHELMFLFNEKPMLVQGCDQQTGVCKLSVIRNRFQRFINTNCAVTFCSNE